MTDVHQNETHGVLAIAARVGAFQLDTSRALSLRPAVASVIAVRKGRVWITIVAPEGDRKHFDEGATRDHVLQAGERLTVPAASHVVVEAWPLDQGAATYFDWDPVPVRGAIGANVIDLSADRLSARSAAVLQARAQWRSAWRDLLVASGRLARAWWQGAPAHNAPHGATPIRPA